MCPILSYQNIATLTPVYIVTTWQGCSLYYFNELEKKCGYRGSRSYFLWGGGGIQFFPYFRETLSFT